MSLLDRKPGQSFTVTGVRVSGEIGKRLVDMGFVEGATGTLVRRAAFRGPVHVRLGAYELLLRASEAARIEVTP